MSPRKPAPAEVSSAIPSLGDLRRAAFITGGTWGVMALGVSVTPMHAPVCADSRAGELHRHGAAATRALTREGPAAALREIAVAVGFAQHAAPPPQIEHLSRPGEMMPVGPVPIAQVPPAPPVVPVVPVQRPIAPMGAPPPVTHAPPPHARPDPPPRIRPLGGARAVAPGNSHPLGDL